MNKARRNELAQLKMKKRRRNYRLPDDVKWYALKSHGKPCSCWVCRNPRYKRKPLKVDYEG